MKLSFCSLFLMVSVSAFAQNVLQINPSFKVKQFTLPGSSVSISPNQAFYAVASYDGSVIVRSLADNSLLLTLNHKKPVYSVTISPDSKEIVTGTENGEIHIWSSNGNKLKFIPFAHKGIFVGHQAINILKFAPDGSYFISGADDGRSAKMWSASGQLLRELSASVQVKEGMASGGVSSVTISTDSNTIVVSELYEGPSTLVWNRNGELKWRFYSSGFSPALLSFDGTTLINVYDKDVQFWDLKTQKLITKTELNETVYSLQLSPNGSKVLATLFGKGTRIFDTLTGELVASGILSENTGWVGENVAVSPNGKCFVTASGDRVTRVWDWSGKVIATLLGFSDLGYPTDAAFTQDSASLIASDTIAPVGGGIKRWNLKDLCGNSP